MVPHAGACGCRRPMLFVTSNGPTGVTSKLSRQQRLDGNSTPQRRGAESGPPIVGRFVMMRTRIGNNSVTTPGERSAQRDRWSSGGPAEELKQQNSPSHVQETRVSVRSVY